MFTAELTGSDLGGVLSDIRPIIAQAQKTAPQGVSIVLRGQASTMSSSFLGLGVGMLVAIALIYLLLVVNFQSWLDPFIILTALTGALAGVIWALHVTEHDLERSSDDGRDHVSRRRHCEFRVGRYFCADSPSGRQGWQLKAAWEAGTGRLRPVIMTATRHDHRHVTDGARSWRWRRAERAARPRGHRRSDARNCRDATFRAGCLQPVASTISSNAQGRTQRKCFHRKVLPMPFPQPKQL